ncbi:hypothetical protein EMIHUDRAFT_422752, partial [Emiliania huxleyi CCMP1516]|uniref:Uncharacterized protein n=2 Tax=Emiliania huxleyi TaxID=2903 RepID=A0A0D3I0U8_EMIH1
LGDAARHPLCRAAQVCQDPRREIRGLHRCRGCGQAGRCRPVWHGPSDHELDGHGELRRPPVCVLPPRLARLRAAHTPGLAPRVPGGERETGAARPQRAAPGRGLRGGGGLHGVSASVHTLCPLARAAHTQRPRYGRRCGWVRLRLSTRARVGVAAEAAPPPGVIAHRP